MSPDLVEQLARALQQAPPEKLRELVRGHREIEEIKRNLGPQTKEELWEFFHKKYGIELVRVAVCPGHVSQLDFVWCVYIFMNVLGVFSRGYGKTSLMALCDDCQAVHYPGWGSFTIGPGKDQGERKYEHLLPFVVDGGVIGGKELDHVQRSIMTKTQYKIGSTIEIALGGCLGRAAKIITREGTLPIGKIVNGQLDVEVKSYNFDRQEWVWSRVIGWHKNGHEQDRKRWRRLKYRLGPTGPSHLTATENHLVLRPDGSKVAVKDLSVGQKICIPAQKLSYDQYQAFIGTMLGDGTLLNTATLSITHCIQQSYYLDWFDDCFSEFAPHRSIRQRFGNRQETTRYKVSMWSKIERERWYPQGVKRIPDDIWNDLDVLGLAAWVMDDGMFVRSPTQVTGTWSICTHHFDQHERDQVDSFFDRIGIDGQWKCVDKEKDHNIWMTKGVEASNMMTVLLHPYIDISQRQYRGWKRWCAADVREHSSEVLWPVEVELVECLDAVPGEYEKQQSITGNGKLFDITVEGTHNYCTAAGVLISNSVENANGPRQPRLHRDEIELMLDATRKQAVNIPAGKQTRDGRYVPAQTVDTSTMKYAGGYVDKEMEAYFDTLAKAGIDPTEMDPIEAFHLAVERGHRPRKLCLVSCVFEIAAENPTCRCVPDNARRPRLLELDRDPNEICDCVVEGSEVLSIGQIGSAFRRFYNGPIVKISTRSGKSISTTVNHPVLTAQGWVLAHLIQEGDHVVSSSDVYAFSSDLDQRPSRVEDVFASLKVEMPSIGARSVSPAAVKFHGDEMFTEGKVDLVTTKLELLRKLDLLELKHLRESLLVGGSPIPQTFLPDPSPESLRNNIYFTSEFTDLLTTQVSLEDAIRYIFDDLSPIYSSLRHLFRQGGDRDTCSRGDGGVGLSSYISVNDLFRKLVLEDASPTRFITNDIARDSSSVDAGISTERFSGLSCEIPLDQVVWKGYCPLALSDTEFIKDSAQTMPSDSRDNLQRSQGFAIEVAPDEVVSVELSYYEGHVFNLSTGSGTFFVDGIVTHNCNTYTSGVWDSDDPESEPPPRTLEDVCQGRFFRSRGYQKFGDIQTFFLDNDRDTWEAEKECSQPSREGAYIKAYSQDRQGIRDYEPDPENGSIFTKTDWGAADEHYTGWIQVLARPVSVRSYKGEKVKILPIGSIVVYSEFMRAQIGNVEHGKIVKAREAEWFLRWPGWNVFERYADNANRGAMLDWRDQCELTIVNRIRKDFGEELKMVRTLVSGHFYVDIPACPALDKALRGWRQINGREVRNEHTHPMAALRYFAHNRHVVERALARAGSKPQSRPAAVEDDDSRPQERADELERGIKVIRHGMPRARGYESVGAAGAVDSPLREGSTRIGDPALRPARGRDDV